MNKYIRISVILCLLLLLGGCTSAAAAENKETVSAVQTADTDTESSRDLFAMDTYMTVKAYGPNAEEAVDAAAAEIERLDALLSTGNADSEVAGLNAAGGGTLSDDTALLMERSLELCQATEGAFDIAIYPVMKAWGFTSGEYRVPADEELASLLTLIDPSLIVYDASNQELSFKKEGVQIDFGGIAKGFTSARIMDIYREYGVTSGMVNLGGNMQVLGTKPDGSSWRVAIQDPDDSDSYIAVLSTSDRAVITSGGYERYFEKEGITYHHIIDPATGYPADSGLISVTIVSADGTLADGLSTSLFIMGMEQAVDYWKDHSEEFDMILVNDEREIFASEGIAAVLTSEKEIHWIEKDEE